MRLQPKALVQGRHSSGGGKDAAFDGSIEKRLGPLVVILLVYLHIDRADDVQSFFLVCMIASLPKAQSKISSRPSRILQTTKIASEKLNSDHLAATMSLLHQAVLLNWMSTEPI